MRVSLLLALVLFFAIGSAAQAANRKPRADAGADRTVGLASTVYLDGGQSRDSDGTIKKYRWRQLRGPKVELLDADAPAASFSAPSTLKGNASSANLVFKLTVADDRNAKASDTVAITVAAGFSCVPPAVAGGGGRCVVPPPICVAPLKLENGYCVLPPPVCAAPEVLLNGSCVAPPPVCVAPQVLVNGSCVRSTSSCALPKVMNAGACVDPEPTPAFNDTGADRCGDGLFLVDCPLSVYPWQDAEYGRDFTHDNDDDGHAGFSFAKLAADGAVLPLDAKEWACIKDEVTGLVWEAKTVESGLHDQSLLYTRYSAQYDPKGLRGGPADAEGYVQAVNAQGFCGLRNWRLPTVGELLGIVDYGVAYPGPSLDIRFFSHTPSLPYWAAESHAVKPESGWVVYFDDGRAFDDDRERGFAVRLVSGEPARQNARHVVASDGQEVADPVTGLIWKRCVEGMKWDGRACVGEAAFYMWDQALHRAEAEAEETGKRWRLPSVKELASLVDFAGREAAIDEKLFPATPRDQFWTSTPYALDSFYAWVVHFQQGSTYYTYLEDNGAARLVRDADGAGR